MLATRFILVNCNCYITW